MYGITALKKLFSFIFKTIVNLQGIDKNGNGKNETYEIAVFAMQTASNAPELFSKISSFLPEGKDLDEKEEKELVEHVRSLGNNTPVSNLIVQAVIAVVSICRMVSIAIAKQEVPKTMIAHMVQNVKRFKNIKSITVQEGFAAAKPLPIQIDFQDGILKIKLEKYWSVVETAPDGEMTILYKDPTPTDDNGEKVEIAGTRSESDHAAQSTCQQCGTAFKARKGKIYCSNKCRSAAHEGKEASL